jgi:hypothetical protein
MTSSVQSIPFVMRPERFWRLLILIRGCTVHPFIYRRGFCHSLEGVILLLAQEPHKNPEPMVCNDFILFLCCVAYDPLKKTEDLFFILAAFARRISCWLCHDP